MEYQKKTSFADIMTFVSDNKKEKENEWKSALRNRIENDISSQVREALDSPPVQRRWIERKKANRQKKFRNLQMMKLNNLHHARPPVFTRMSDESSSDRSFKYIDVNYVPKAGSFGSGNQKMDKLTSLSKSLTGLDGAKRNGLLRYAGSLPPDAYSSNMRGGLDVTLLDTSSSASLNFLSLPKHEIPPNLRPIGPGVGMITFNGITLPNYGASRKCFQTYSKTGLNNLLNSRNRRNKLTHVGHGTFVDKRGIVLSKHGPFWPPGYGPVCQCPDFIDDCKDKEEFGPQMYQPLKNQSPGTMNGHHKTNCLDQQWRPAPHHNHQPVRDRGDGKHYLSSISENARRHERQHTTIGQFYSDGHENSNSHQRNYNGFHGNERHHHGNKFQNAPQKPQWRGKPVIYDCERSSRAPLPHAVPEGMSESLVFESRFESGNLRQVRRIGELEYELVLRTDMYTKRHTQWYYFRVQKAQKDVTYKINIINLLKKDSLYNYGMKPLVYSEHLAKEEKLGWHRMGENIRYLPWSNQTRNGLLSLDLQYYSLEFEISFEWENVEDDSIYLAHCYPYTYSDLKRHLDSIMTDPEQAKHVKREVLCETTAGNACFLLTITDFPDKEKDKYKDFHQEKKGVVVTARVHPGETQASWMMKGVIDFLTSDCAKAIQLRKKFIFKIVPMLNPDGVIVGNYRTSLAARDLNRNYRHPRQSAFPTVWHTKQMVDLFSKDHEIVLYCDLHGHSRKPMVFMYGCERKALYNGSGKQNGDEAANRSPRDCAKDFIEERLFPWLMHKRAPERFSFHSSKYAVRRCKEATGRVVMFRQFGIANSFTMEASFSGTMRKKLDSGRHFNIEDFLSVGKALCESVLDYSKLSENALMKSRIIMEMTKDLAQHMIETNPHLAQAKPTDAGKEAEKAVENVTVAKAATSSATAAVSNMKPDSKQASPGILSSSSSSEIKGTMKQGPSTVQNGKSHAEPKPNRILTKSTQETEIRVITPPPHEVSVGKDAEAEEGDSEESGVSKLDENCYKLLEQLNFQEIAVESGTSSDSDSESDPELPPEAPMMNRGKRKKRRKKRPKYMKSVSAPSSMTSRKIDTKEDMTKTKPYPAFVNRYTHRSNGGIPIYAQERIQERAARRLAELKLAEEEKNKRQADLLLGSSDELKDDERSKYAEVYGIHYQLGPHPNKSQYTVYNPFRSTSPSTARSDIQQPCFRYKNEGSKLPPFYQTHGLGELSSGSGSDKDRRQTDALNHSKDKSPRKHNSELSDGESYSSGDEKPTQNGGVQTQHGGSKSHLPLQTCNLSFKIAGEGQTEGRNYTSAANRHWVAANDSKLLSSVKDWHWESANYERTISDDPSTTKQDGKAIVDRAVKKPKPPDPISRVSSASTLPPSDPFTPKNIVQYEVVIGPARYPIQIHRHRLETAGPPMITGESILNQKPSEVAHSAGQKRSVRRPRSADCKTHGSAGSDDSSDRCFVRTHSIGDGGKTGSSDSARGAQFDEKAENGERKSARIPAKTNGLVFAVHKVNVVQPSGKFVDSAFETIAPLRNTPYPPKRASTMFSPIVKPLTASTSSRQRPYSVSTDPDFNVNSAR